MLCDTVMLHTDIIYSVVKMRRTLQYTMNLNVCKFKVIHGPQCRKQNITLESNCITNA